MKRILLLFACCFLFAAFLNAQDVIYLNNGNVVEGKVVKNADEISVVISSGETLTYRKTEVRKVQIGNTEVVQPKDPKIKKYVDYSDKDKGWWCAVEVFGAGQFYNPSAKLWDAGLIFTNGYRFNEYIRLGAGIGFRYAIHDLIDGETTDKFNPVGIPLLVNLRGNAISQKSRMCVPFWNFDAGIILIENNFFFNAGFGFRAGGKRNNFVMTANYMGQLINYNPNSMKYAHGIMLKLGYEF